MIGNKTLTKFILTASMAVLPFLAVAQSGPPAIPGQQAANPYAAATQTTKQAYTPQSNPYNPAGQQTSNSPPLLIDQAEAEINNQAQGNFPELNRNTSISVGALQKAWDIPRASSGQTSPGIIRYAWHPNLVMAIRTREYMVSTIHLPEWERLTNLIVGDPVVFEARQVKPNVFAIRPVNGGADTNVTAIGVSGNVYNFYIRSEGWNSEHISDFTVYVDKNSPGEGSSSVLARSSGGSNITDVISSIPAHNSGGNNFATSLFGSLTPTTNSTSNIQAPDYLRNIAFRPDALQFNMKIFAKDEESKEIAPVRVFHDGIWTYFDYGDKADYVRRPVVYMVVDGVDSMVNTRTAGPTGNVLIAEAIGDFTLRNGSKVVCVFREETVQKRSARALLSDEAAEYAEPGLENQHSTFSSAKIEEKPRGSFFER